MKETNLRNKILKNLISYSVGNIISKLLIFIFGVIAARYFGSVVFGKYNYATSLVSYFIMFAAMGIQSYAVYLITKKPELTNEAFCDVISGELFLGLVSTIVLVIFVQLVPTNSTMVLAAGSTILINALNIDWLFRAKQSLVFVSIQVILIGIIQCVIVALSCHLNWGNPLILPCSVSIAQLLGNTFLLIIAKRKLSLKYTFRLLNLLNLIKHGIPFLFSGIFAGINCNIDILFLGNMVAAADVGKYSAAYKVINILVLMVTIFFAPVYPVLIENYSLKKFDIINQQLSKSLKYLLIIIFPIVCGGMIIGEQLIVFMYGIEYSGTGLVFIILLVYVLLFYVREVFGYLISASGNQTYYMKITCISAGINIIANTILIPSYGIVGAAVATVLSEVVNLIYMMIISKKIILLKLSNIYVWKTLAATVIMGTFTLLFTHINVPLIINLMASAIVYFVVLKCLKMDFNFNL